MAFTSLSVSALFYSVAEVLSLGQELFPCPNYHSIFVVKLGKFLKLTEV